ncbi:MAG: beta-propeller fold lactonase family protein, partial [Gemmatimonadota bacterium]|nr:beta-propeller fold lactonase family protein [Gemmatimonadota bacterium]
MSSNARTVRVFVGTYTQTTSKGIYVYDVDTATGVMEYVSHVGGITNPSFLVLTPD